MNDNTPAFPHTRTQFDDATSGMELRDYFAAQVMSAYVSAETIKHVANKYGFTVAATVAKAAYEIADAMMEARNVDPTTTSKE